MRVGILSGLLVFASLNGALAESYIDEIKRGLPPKENPGSLIDAVRSEPAPEDSSSAGYTDSLKQSLPPGGSQNFTGDIKQGLEPKKDGGAIQAVFDGTSDLKLKRDGDIHHAYGLRVGASLSRFIDAESGYKANEFSSVYYASGWQPDFTLHYEYQLFHNEWAGSIGLFGEFGAMLFRGSGRFGVDLGTYGSTSRVKMSFLALPTTIGVNYRFNMLRIVRPYVGAGATLVGFFESRSDDGATIRGNSKAYTLQGGVAILLDWISDEAAWNLYDEHKIKHSYLTIEYQKVKTLSGIVDFDISGFYAGLTFEI